MWKSGARQGGSAAEGRSAPGTADQRAGSRLAGMKGERPQASGVPVTLTQPNVSREVELEVRNVRNRTTAYRFDCTRG